MPFEVVAADVDAEDDASGAAPPDTVERAGDSWEVEGRAARPAPAPSSAEAAPADEALEASAPGAATDAELSARSGGASMLRVIGTGGQRAHLRAAPSAAAESLAVLPDGAVVEALGPGRAVGEDGWRQVRAPDGTAGWVASWLLEPTADE